MSASPANPAVRVHSNGKERLGLTAVIVIIFALSWLSTIPQILASWRGAGAVPVYIKLLQIFLIAPGLVALWAAYINGGWSACKQLLKRLIAWRVSWKLYVAVLLGPPAVILVSLLLSNTLGYTQIRIPDAGSVFAVFVPTFIVYLILNTEELAWRGYVLPRMQGRWNPLVASLVLGVIWTVFHAPYFLMKGGHPGGFTPVMFVLALLPMTVLLTRVFNSAAGSVLLTHLLHQSINSWAESLPFLPRHTGNTAPLWIAIVLLIVLAGYCIVAKPSMWKKLSS
jgi:membrane protease YdiL (CAAX protease family)